MNNHISFGTFAVLLWGALYCAAQSDFAGDDKVDEKPAQSISDGTGPSQFVPRKPPAGDPNRFVTQPADSPETIYGPKSAGPGRAQPQLGESLLTGPSPFEAPKSIVIQYVIQKPVTETFRTPDGETHHVTKYILETREQPIEVDADLKQLDLPPEGKRYAVLAVTAARHQGLLEKLKAAKTPEEKEAASLALKENYSEHYAIETWWRKQKLAELETRLLELRAQVTRREASEEKYIEAAMTIAELWASGIGISPPMPSRQPVGTPALALPPSGPHGYYIPSRGPNEAYVPSSRSPAVYGPTTANGPPAVYGSSPYRPAAQPDDNQPGLPVPRTAPELPPAPSRFDTAP